MTSESSYAFRAITGRETVDVLEIPGQGSAKSIRVCVDGAVIATIAAQVWQFTGFSLGTSRIAVWVGVNFYHGSKTGPLMHVEMSEEVRAAFEIGSTWCVVTELSVLLLDLQDATQYDAIRHHEVIMSHSWSGDILEIKDFEQRQLRVRVDREQNRLCEVKKH